MLHKRKDSPYWWVSYTNPSGKRARRSTGTADRKEAEALAAKWRLETFQAKQWGKQPSRSFDELMLAYLKATQDEKRSAERDRYSAKHLCQFFTGYWLETLKGSDIRAYIEARKSEGATAGTVNREIGLFSSAINYARNEWDWDIPNPAMGKRLREPEGRIRWLAKEEAARLIRAATTDPRATHLPDLIRLAVHSGMRKGEMLGLEWRRVDLKNNLVHLGAEHTKAGKRRSVPLNDEARSALLSRAGFRAQYCPDSPWVFANRKGERIGSVKSSFTRACRLAKIEDFRVHDLRHTCAAWLVNAGASLIEVRELLGHSTIRMTERYAHLAPDNVRNAVAKLDVRSRFGHVAA
jgi:integrase